MGWPTRWTDGRRRGVVARAGLAAAVLTLAGAAHAGIAVASSPLEDCVQRKVDAGMPRAAAQAECIKEVGPASATTRPAPGGAADDESDSGSRPTVSADDGGTSVGALLGVGLGGLVVGAGLAALVLRRRPAAPVLPAGPVAPPVGGLPPTSPFAGPPGAVPGGAPSTPAPSAAPGGDRGPTLVVALVDLADRVNSQALRADILAALARVGVHQIDIAAGEAFDANRMRGVGSAPTADPALVGRVAATDRPGFRDGTQVVRLPDVIVHVAG